jgi:hypothetical protein
VTSIAPLHHLARESERGGRKGTSGIAGGGEKESCLSTALKYTQHRAGQALQKLRAFKTLVKLKIHKINRK